MPTALDNGQRSPRKLLRKVVARLLGRQALEQRALELLVLRQPGRGLLGDSLARPALPAYAGNWHTLSEVGTTSPLPEVGNGYGSRNRRSCPGLNYG
jgi:hypothetical protein